MMRKKNDMIDHDQYMMTGHLYFGTTIRDELK